MSVSVPRLSRRPALRLMLAMVPAGLLLAGCAKDAPPPDFRPFAFDYLPKIRLNVATIDVQNAWQPAAVPNGTHVEAMAPVQPIDSIQRMVQDRMLPVGTTGHAVLTVEDASLIQRAGQFEGSLKVRLDISATDGGPTSWAEASAYGTQTITGDSPAVARQLLYDLVKKLMKGDVTSTAISTGLNAELEKQVHKSLAAFVQGPAAATAPAQPVQTQDLQPSGSTPPAQ